MPLYEHLLDKLRTVRKGYGFSDISFIILHCLQYFPASLSVAFLHMLINRLLVSVPYGTIPCTHHRGATYIECRLEGVMSNHIARLVGNRRQLVEIATAGPQPPRPRLLVSSNNLLDNYGVYRSRPFTVSKHMVLDSRSKHILRLFHLFGDIFIYKLNEDMHLRTGRYRTCTCVRYKQGKHLCTRNLHKSTNGNTHSKYKPPFCECWSSITNIFLYSALLNCYIKS